MNALIKQKLKLILASHNFAKFIHDMSSDPEIKNSAAKVAKECELSLSEIERYRKEQQ